MKLCSYTIHHPLKQYSATLGGVVQMDESGRVMNTEVKQSFACLDVEIIS
jgi:hypothetical protein